MCAQVTRPITIADVIRQVHLDLLRAERSRIDSGLAPLFKVKSLSLELNVAVSQSDEIKGGLDLKVFSLGATSHASKEEINKITLHLDVADASPPPARAPAGTLPSRVK